MSDDEKLIKNDDKSIVVVRPKFYIGSSGSVWASDLLRIRYEHTSVFEVKVSGNALSNPARRVVAFLRDSGYYFKDTTTYEDLKCLVSNLHNHHEYREYETLRL